MVKIPIQLQLKRPAPPPAKALTLAQQRALRQPLQPQPQLDPVEQQQVIQHQQTISKLDVSVQEIDKQLSEIKATRDRKIIGQEPSTISAINKWYNNQRQSLEATKEGLISARNVAQEYIVSYEEAISYGRQIERIEKIEQRRVREYEKRLRKPRVTMEEIPRRIITREGTFLEYKSGRRVKVSEERIPETYRFFPKPKPTQLQRVGGIFSGLYAPQPLPPDITPTEIKLQKISRVSGFPMSVISFMAKGGERELERNRGLIQRYEAGETLTSWERAKLMEIGYLEDTRYQLMPYGLQPYRRKDKRFQITKFLIEKPTEFITGEKPPVWQMEFLDYMLKIGIFAPYMTTMATKKGKVKPKQKSKQKLVKVSKKLRDRVVSDLDDVIKNSKTKQEANRNLLEYMKDFKEEMRARGISEDVINENLKSIFEYAQSRDFLLIKVGFGAEQKIATTDILKPIVEEFIGVSKVPVGKIAPSVFAGMGLYERYAPSELLQPPKLKPRVEEKLGAGGVFSGTAPTGRIGLLDTGKISPLGELGKFGDLGVTKTRVDTRQASSLLTGQISKPEIREREKLKLAPRLKERERLAQPTASKLLTGQSFVQPQLQIPRLAQPQILRQPEVFRYPTPTITPTPTPKPPREKIPKKPKLPKFIPFWFAGEKPRYKKEIPYDSFALIDATKERKRYWKKLNTQPLTRSSARDLGAEYIDREISATARISPQKTKIIKGKKVKPKQIALDLKSNYFEINRHKFRDWEQKKGQRVQTPNQIIERQPYRQDSPTERRQLQSARMSSLLYGGSPQRKSKTKSRRRRFRL